MEQVKEKIVYPNFLPSSKIRVVSRGEGATSTNEVKGSSVEMYSKSQLHTKRDKGTWLQIESRA